MSNKTEDEYFRDWESTTFGFGYGTGEEYVLKALKTFFTSIEEDDSYNHENLSHALTPTVAWLLINVLCNSDIIDYGTSPRYGWLTISGKNLKSYIDSRTEEQLISLVCETDENSNICYRNHCNCETKQECNNPFWIISSNRSRNGNQLS